MSDPILSLPADSFLEYAFVKWVLRPAVQDGMAKRIHPQQEVSAGDRSYRIDYVIEGGMKLAVELDGFEYHGGVKAFTYDRLRQNDLQALNFLIVRFTYSAIRLETGRCVEQLQAILRQDPKLATLLVANPVVLKPDDMPVDPIASFNLPPRRQSDESLPLPIVSEPIKNRQSYFDQIRGKINRETLRDCQTQAFSALGNYYSSGGAKAACVMSVGAGKTALGITAVLAFAKARAMIVTPGNVIKGTFANALDHAEPKNVLYGLPKGPLLPGSPPPKVMVLDRENQLISNVSRSTLSGADVIVTNFHSLGFSDDPDSLLAKLNPDDIDFIVVDEAHIAASDSYQRLFSHFFRARTLLLSACFKRLDGKPIDADVVYRYRLVDSIAEGNAKNIRLHRFAPDDDSTVYEIAWPNGSREEIQGRAAILELLKDEKRLSIVTARSHEPIRQVMRATKHLLDAQANLLNPIRPRALFAALGQKHAEQIAMIATECGIASDVLHHSMSHSRIRSVKERFESPSGDLQCIVQLKMLGQGYDFPPITVVVPFRPYGSFSEFYQFIGRGIRVIRHPALQGRVRPADQYLDIVLHADLNLDDHIQTIYEENDMDPSEVHEVPASWKPPSSGDDDLPISKGRNVAERPDAYVLFQPGTIEERMVHDDDRVEAVRAEREQKALAQRYATYAQGTKNPVSFEQYCEVIDQLRGNAE